MQHLFPYLKFGDEVVYVDLSYPQCGLKRCRDNMRLNPGSPYRLVTDDITLGGAVTSCRYRTCEALDHFDANDPKLIPIDRVLEKVIERVKQQP